jgi:hypothetical protein
MNLVFYFPLKPCFQITYLADSTDNVDREVSTDTWMTIMKRIANFSLFDIFWCYLIFLININSAVE